MTDNNTAEETTGERGKKRQRIENDANKVLDEGTTFTPEPPELRIRRRCPVTDTFIVYGNFRLKTKFTVVGRSLADYSDKLGVSTLTLRSVFVSRLQATFTRHSDDFTMKNESTTAPMYLNDKGVASLETASLANNDVVTFGDFSVTIVIKKVAPSAKIDGYSISKRPSTTLCPNVFKQSQVEEST